MFEDEDHNDEGDAILLTQNSMMEVIHAGDMCLNEETDPPVPLQQNLSSPVVISYPQLLGGLDF